MLERDHIRIRQQATDWRDCIRLAGEILIDLGSVGESYISRMLQSVDELGPYIVIIPGFALAHAAPGEDVYRSDVALITLSEPVEFGSANDPVKVVMCLGCTDSKSHIDMLSEIAEKLMEEGKIEEIASAGSIDEVLAVIS